MQSNIKLYFRGAGGRTVFPVRENGQEPSNEMNVVGHTRPSKVQDRTRIFDTKGIGPALRATDYKDPTKIVQPVLTPDRIEKRQNGRRFKEDGFRIRKLTEKECWRLQGFTDEQFYKAKNDGVSNSQLYKQAGNSVSVPVIKAIAERL